MTFTPSRQKIRANRKAPASRLSRSQYAKVAVKDKGIDHQILSLHQAMAKKCLEQPCLFNHVIERIERRYQAKQMRYGAYLTWLAILDLRDSPELFLDALLEKSVKMRNLRRATVFTQILSEEERVDIMSKLNSQAEQD
ncbi:hypothetical protein ISG33_07110 [Glaciecola sp. MH2013]|uniref:hypothetical protein n=1 Tax=Glaciecola sp. MH2013 TaxID=2785524 RepID=UPI00189FBF4E|nr:hypothetical protein [Glaciecola sp. MH2013]MBF7073162.1 hypothetical protein [Glaciecola sp. MH2013]